MITVRYQTFKIMGMPSVGYEVWYGECELFNETKRGLDDLSLQSLKL
ncbi:hypothetical protein Hanom_Chr17g01568121 [Helianthus anomalus]